MSTYMRARLASDKVDAQGHFEPLVGYHVALRSHQSLFGNELASVATKADGLFEFVKYRGDPSGEGHHRTLELVVQDPVGRPLPFAATHQVSSRFAVDEAGRIRFEDVDDEQIIEGDFIVREADAKGFLVTLGTGETPITLAPGENPTGATVASGWGLSHGNAVKLLMDNDAFIHAAALMRDAEESITMSQLFFALPIGFEADATRETTTLVFDFHRPDDNTPLDLDHPRAAGVGDARPERLLVEAADRDVDIRVLLHAFKVPLFIKIIAGALLFPFAGTDGVFAVAGEILDADLTDTDEARRYFGEAARPKIKVEDFEQPVLSAGVMHAKLMIADGRHALSIGSPFGQSYVDSHDHRIDAWIRGRSEGLPKHDAGFALTGPAVGDLHQTLKLLWDTEAPDDRLETLPRNPPPQTEGGDGICSVQIVRTLSAGRFDEPSEGEKGILEGYLRAIANAEDFIYLETQYFTDDPIGHALVEAMKRKPHLQVIVVLNIQPDVPFYPFKQRRLITRIRKGIGQKPDGPQRFGVFTRWTHEVGQPRPRILPIYIHAKVGIVDDTWATVGSANLDGLSLDSFLLNIFHEQRAIEVNALLFNGVDGQPPSDVVDILRRKLWAEHLGYSVAPDVPDIAAADLTKRPEGGWLKLWSDRAGAALQQLRDSPSLPMTGMARVLPWPTDDTTHKTPRDHLNALGIRTHAVVPLKSTRAFDFETGDWKRGSKAAMDYD